MKTWMKSTLAATVVSLGALGAGAAYAWGGPCDGQGPHAGKGGYGQVDPERMQERMKARMTGRMAELEQALKLRPEQAAAWQTYQRAKTDRMSAGMGKMAQLMREDTPLTAPERMSRMETLMDERVAAMRAMHVATRSFYDQLDAAQQKVFDEHFGQGPMRDGRGPGRGPGRGAPQ